MSAYTAAYRFSTVVQAHGVNHVIAAAEGETIDLEDWLADEVLIQVPGALIGVTPTPEDMGTPDVETAPGPVAEAKTRAVVGVKKKAQP